MATPSALVPALPLPKEGGWGGIKNFLKPSQTWFQLWVGGGVGESLGEVLNSGLNHLGFSSGFWMGKSLAAWGLEDWERLLLLLLLPPPPPPRLLLLLLQLVLTTRILENLRGRICESGRGGYPAPLMLWLWESLYKPSGFFGKKLPDCIPIIYYHHYHYH